MRVTMITIENALLDIFLCEDVPAGGKLLMFDLRQEWAKTHLRYDDLQAGIQSLTQSGELAVRKDPEDDCVQLTARGFQRCITLPEHAGALWMYFQGLMLSHLPVHREAPLPSQDYQRRCTDARA